MTGSEASERKGGASETRDALRVLIVDDLPEIRFLLEVALSREPAVRIVGQAEDGRQAVEKVEFLHPDLVVMDRQMPVMDGMEATRRITTTWPGVEVVGFTSSGPAAGHDAMCEAGASESFDKTNMKALLQLIRSRAASLAPAGSRE